MEALKISNTSDSALAIEEAQPSDNKLISVLNINATKTVPPHLLPALKDLIQLRNIANAIYHINHMNYSNINMSFLYRKCAELLTSVTGYLNNLQDIHSLTLRSLYLKDGCTNKELLQETINCIERELLIIIGPMITTWVNHERVKHFSYIAAIPNATLNKVVDDYYQNQDKLLEYARFLVNNNELYFKQIPIFIVSDILLAGGVGDTYPKHFAYFLPEDEVKSYAKTKKTVIFANLYRHRLINTTLPLGKQLVASFNSTGINIDKCANYFLLWMRGHDIGHFATLPTTNYKWLRQIGYFNSMALQEVLADCFGYLLTFGEFGINEISLNAECIKNLILAEMSRYYLKDVCETPDSYAAFIELNFLIKNKFVTIRNNQLKSSPEQLYQGFKALIQVVTNSILTASISASLNIIKMYGDQRSCPLELRIFLGQARQTFKTISQGEIYVFENS